MVHGFTAIVGFRSRFTFRWHMLGGMPEVTQLLEAAAAGDAKAAAALLPIVYDELRKLAAARMAEEKPGQTLQATALVHEAYLRLVGQAHEQLWDNRGHFFAAAAEAMRRILIESVRKKRSLKQGGQRQRAELLDDQAIAQPPDERLLALDEALERFGREQPRMAELVRLRFFAGLSIEEVANLLGISSRTAKRDWTFARAWLRREMDRE
jgi:RNA polymerase sigma factor (TIGR02999 family)